MYTELEKSPPQYRAICGILSNLDLTQLNAPMVINPETLALLDSFSEADWDLFTRMAKAEGVAPLMHYAFTRSTYPLPDATRQKLLMIYYETAAFNQLILAEMGRVVQALNDANIPVIVLKGAALASTIYPDPALRPMSDLDLLVKTEDLERAKELILSMGYCEPIPEMARGINRLTGHEYKLNHNNQPAITIELHWSVIAGDYDQRTPYINWFGDNPTTSIIAIEQNHLHIEFATLSSVTTLCYLIGHLVIQHGISTSRLIWLFDIILMISQNEKENFFNQFINEICAMKWLAAVKFAIELIKTHFNKEIPISLLNIVNEKSTEIENVIRINWEGNQNVHNFYILQVLTIKGKKKISLLHANIFPSSEYMRWRYNYRWRWQIIYYYPYRWWEIIIKSIRALVLQKF